MILLPLTVLTSFLTAAAAAPCQVSVTNDWPNKRQLKIDNLKLKNSNLNGWEITIKFTQNVDTLLFYEGKPARVDSRTYKVKNQDWSRNWGTVRSGMQLTYGDSKPEIQSVAYNGRTICGTTEEGGSSTSPPTPSSGQAACSYKEAVHLSGLFYEAQRSGKLPDDQRVKWRKDSALSDQGNNGEDLSGGYYDGGDHCKFGFPLAVAMTLLSWGGINYEANYKRANEFKVLLNTVKWGTDYMLKAHTKPNELYVQVCDGEADHAVWQPPQRMTMNRPAYKLTKGKPGSDAAGETAAALTAASILFKGSNSSYSNKLLDSAKQLYNFAKTYRGKYSEAVPAVAEYYKSWGYIDELCWAAAWLYKATGDASYLQDARSFYDQKGFQKADYFSWDQKLPGATALLAELTKESRYKNDLKSYCDYWRNSRERSPKGLVFIAKWGSNRHAANSAMLCLRAADMNIDKAANRALAQNQLDYLLGSKGQSYVIGCGRKYPVKPHHTSATCPVNGRCGWKVYEDESKPNANNLLGALVGGAKAADDGWKDLRTDYLFNEVTLDYNAGFQTLAAGLM